MINQAAQSTSTGLRTPPPPAYPPLPPADETDQLYVPVPPRSVPSATSYGDAPFLDEFGEKALVYGDAETQPKRRRFTKRTIWVFVLIGVVVVVGAILGGVLGATIGEKKSSTAAVKTHASTSTSQTTTVTSTTLNPATSTTTPTSTSTSVTSTSSSPALPTPSVNYVVSLVDSEAVCPKFNLLTEFSLTFWGTFVIRFKDPEHIHEYRNGPR